MRAALPLLLALLAGCGGCASVPKYDEISPLALTLIFERGLCSGTPIGPDSLLTAKHCGEGGRLVSVNGSPVKVIGYGDRADTATYRVEGVTFKRWGRMGREPKPGDRIRFIGNPMGVKNVYREGYVVLVTPTQIAIDAIICKGDSGSALWDDKGRIVGIVNLMTSEASCHFGLNIR